MSRGNLNLVLIVIAKSRDIHVGGCGNLNLILSFTNLHINTRKMVFQEIYSPLILNITEKRGILLGRMTIHFVIRN